MTDPTPGFERLLVALLIGLLIGLDRERAEVRKRRRQFAGIRTFPLIALAGALPFFLMDEAAGPALLAVAFLAIAVLTAISYYRGSARGAVGTTTETAAIVTFLLGAMAGAGQMLLAAGVGIIVAILLVAKPRLEGFSHALSEEELSATLELAVISCIVLPLLPNQAYGPWQILNPFEIWLVVVLVSGLSFGGFIATRLLGEQRGILAAGVAGAIVSSTAVTAAMAQRSREHPEDARSIASATILASLVMCLRVVVVAGAAGPGLLPRLLPPIAAMSGVAAVAAWWCGRGGPAQRPTKPAAMKNPFSLRAAITFGALFAAVLFVVRAAQELPAVYGTLVAAILPALIDVDAVTIALARAGPGSSEWRLPAAAILLAAVTNTAVKLVMAVGLGAGPFRWYVGTALGLMGLVGGAFGLLVFLRF